MRNCFPCIGLFIFLSTAATFLVGCNKEAQNQDKGSAPDKKPNPAAPPDDPAKKPPSPEVPPDAGPSKLPSGKTPLLADLKFNLPKGWEAKHRDGSNSWLITKAPFEDPSVLAGWALTRDYPKDLDDYVEKLKNKGDHFAYGLYWASVTEKGKLPDGLYVVGKLKLKADKEAKHTGFSIIRDLGGEKVIFECFSVDDDKQRKEAMDLCKAAKF